jgi:hypothetical protein
MRTQKILTVFFAAVFLIATAAAIQAKPDKAGSLDKGKMEKLSDKAADKAADRMKDDKGKGKDKNLEKGKDKSEAKSEKKMNKKAKKEKLTGLKNARERLAANADKLEANGKTEQAAKLREKIKTIDAKIAEKEKAVDAEPEDKIE